MADSAAATGPTSLALLHERAVEAARERVGEPGGGEVIDAAIMHLDRDPDRRGVLTVTATYRVRVGDPTR